MVRVSAERHSGFGNDYLHYKPRGILHYSLFPDFIRNIFRDGCDFVNKGMNKGSIVLDSMFPSLFDGIRLGSRHEDYFVRTNPKEPDKPSKARIIPIQRVSPKHNTRIKVGKPVISDDVVEVVDCTVDSSSSIKDHRCQLKNKCASDMRTDAVITLDSDIEETPDRESSHARSSLKNSPARHSSELANPIILDDDEPKGIRSNASDSSALVQTKENSNFKKKQTSVHEIQPDSMVTLDDDCSSDEEPQRNGIFLRTSPKKCSELVRPSVRRSIPVLHLQTILPASTSNKADREDSFSFKEENKQISEIVAIEDGDVDPEDMEVSTIITSNPSSNRSSDIESGECHIVHLNSPAPDYPVYNSLTAKLFCENRKIHYITGDGNCFFRALSTLLFGCEDKHREIRRHIVKFIAANEKRFSQFIDEEDVQTHIKKMSEDHCWATTCEIYAAATILQRNIYMLTPNHLNNEYSWLLFKPLFHTKEIPGGFTNHPCYITLCNTNGNHYDLVLADRGHCNCFLRSPELNGISATIDLS